VPRRDGLHLCRGEVDGEGGAVAQFAFDGDLSAVGAHELASDGQTQAAARTAGA